MSGIIGVFGYENCESKEITLLPGIYLFEVWGAEGGLRLASFASGGKGGYSRGELTLKKETNFFLHIGQKGFDNTASVLTSAACNGGGSGYYVSGGGGGGTDIRVLSDDLYHRIIVAGGGGGTGDISGEYGGYGGGIIGGNGEDQANRAGRGGNQGSETITCADGIATNCPPGIFGYGGNSSMESYYTGGGGGGWFGGSASYQEEGGGGGSGYVLTETSFKPPNYISSYPQYYFTNSSLVGGNETIPCIESCSTEIGHSGHGAIRITHISSLVVVTVSNKCPFICLPNSYSLIHLWLSIILTSTH